MLPQACGGEAGQNRTTAIDKRQCDAVGPQAGLNVDRRVVIDSGGGGVLQQLSD